MEGGGWLREEDLRDRVEGGGGAGWVREGGAGWVREGGSRGADLESQDTNNNSKEGM